MKPAINLRPLFFLMALLGVLLAAPLDAQRTDRAKSIGKRLMCMCGCNQILVECNHVGCSVSAEMLKKLDQRVALNEADDMTVQYFVQEYGAAVLAQPPAKGFSLVAWVMPVVALLAGTLIVWTALRRMRRPSAAGTPAPAGPPHSPEELDRWRGQADRESEE